MPNIVNSHLPYLFFQFQCSFLNSICLKPGYFLPRLLSKANFFIVSDSTIFLQCGFVQNICRMRHADTQNLPTSYHFCPPFPPFPPHQSTKSTIFFQFQQRNSKNIRENRKMCGGRQKPCISGFVKTGIEGQKKKGILGYIWKY